VHGVHYLDSPVLKSIPHFHGIVQQVQAITVNWVLVEATGNQVRAATLLGLNRTTLRKKMRLWRPDGESGLREDRPYDAARKAGGFNCAHNKLHSKHAVLLR
jgi:hypothetical protein